MKIKVLFLVFAMILTMIVPAQANTSFSQDNLLQTEEYFGKYVVSVKMGDAWNEINSLNFGKYQSKQTIDIGEYLSSDSIIVKLEQKCGGSAYLDAVLLGDNPAINVSDTNGKVLNKLSKEDLDITPVGEEGVILKFASCDNGILTVVGRIEPVVISKEPLQFPAANNYKTKDEVRDFYNYTLGRNLGTVSVDGLLDEVKDLEPFVKEYRVPGSGHPAGDTYFWVMNDNDNLYVTMDVTPDNTFDGDKDYAKVYINTDEGIKEFRVSVPETIWGNTSFTYTDKVGYEHKVYEFAIPLSEVNTNNDNNIKLSFVVYGTVAMPTEFYTPDLAYDANSDFYVCVYGGYNDSGYYIWADIIKSDGTVLNENPIMISDWEFKESFTPSIAYDYLNDSFMVVWCQGYSNTKIYGRLFKLIESDENIYIDFLTEEFRVSGNEDINGTEWKFYNEFQPDIAFNRNYEDGKYNEHYLIVWTQRANDNPVNLSLTENDIYGRFISPDGTLVGDKGFVICGGNGNQYEPSLSYSFRNEMFMLAWIDESSEIYSVNARVINEDGTLGKGINPIKGDVKNPNIAINERNGFFLLSWVQNNQTIGVYCYYHNDDDVIKFLDTFTLSATTYETEYPVSIFGKDNMLSLWNALQIDSDDSYAKLSYWDIYGPINEVFETENPELTEYNSLDKSIDLASNCLSDTGYENFLLAYINKGGEAISYRAIGEVPPPIFKPYIEFDKDEYDIDLITNNTIQAEVFHFKFDDQDNGYNITNNEYIHYKSNDESVATISEAGLITGLANGTTTIEAVYYEPQAQYRAMSSQEENEFPYGELQAVATVTVTKTEPKEPKLSFDKDTYSVVIRNAPYQTNVNYFDGITNHIVTNSENILYFEGDSNIADIVTGGAIKGISSGTTTISAIYTVGELTLTAEAYVNVTKLSSTSSTPRTPIGEILVDKKVIQTLYEEDVNVKNNTYIFTADEEGNNAKLWIDSSFYKELAKEYPNRSIKFVWDKGTYTLPLSCDEVLDEIDSSAKKINILLEKIGDKKIIDAAMSSATNMGAEIISDLIDFCVFVEKSDKNVEINSLDFYAVRTINELNEIDDYISTAMKFVENIEALTFAPSIFGKDYASIKYRGNGIFTIIENPQTFNDIGSHWAKINIEKLASRNIAFGRQNKQFAPDDYVTRAEFAVMITRALGITEEEGTNDFKDVSNEWFAEDISTAFEANLINGRNDGKFYPNERIQRKDMAVMINNALKFADSGVEITNIDKVLSIFNDYSIIDAYAKESTAVCTNVGIIMGRDTKDFDPNENATRAEASAILERMLRYLDFMN